MDDDKLRVIGYTVNIAISRQQSAVSSFLAVDRYSAFARRKNL